MYQNNLLTIMSRSGCQCLCRRRNASIKSRSLLFKGQKVRPATRFIEQQDYSRTYTSNKHCCWRSTPPGKEIVARHNQDN